jgi:hypothetical protein
VDVITCGILPGKVELVNLLVDTHKSTLPGVWVRGSDRIAIYSSSRLEAKANERPAQLYRRSNMDISLNIKMRCGSLRRQNDAAYQRHRRRSVSASAARLPLSHGPVVLRSGPGKRERSPGPPCKGFKFKLLTCSGM